MQNNNEIKISLITITYNSEKTLQETMESVLQQKYRPLQYVIVDGNSSDSTMSIVESYITKFEMKGIEYSYISEADKGISDAFNKGIKIANGKILGIINSDDKLCEDATSIVCEEYNPSVDVYFGDCIVFNNKKKEEYIAVPNASRNLSLLKKGMAIFHPSTFICKAAYDKFGGYDISCKYCMDRELLLRFLDNGVLFKYIHKPLACYREGGVNQINYNKCATENMNISIRYGMSKTTARRKKAYYFLYDNMWKIVQKMHLESVFHQRINVEEKKSE